VRSPERNLRGLLCRGHASTRAISSGIHGLWQEQRGPATRPAAGLGFCGSGYAYRDARAANHRRDLSARRRTWVPCRRSERSPRVDGIAAARTIARNTVVALGGGTFAQLPNLELLRPWPTVFLDAPVDDLWQRTLEDAAKRPLRGDRTEFSRLHHERLPFYRQARVTIVTSGKDPDSLCAEIESTLHSWGKLGQEEFDPGKMVQRKPRQRRPPPVVSYPSPRDYSGTGETK